MTLLNRIEAAPIGSRELDALIWERFNRRSYPVDLCTTSLDAALALAASLGWRLYYLDTSIEDHATVTLRKDVDDFARAHAATPPLAIVAALLRATEQDARS